MIRRRFLIFTTTVVALGAGAAFLLILARPEIMAWRMSSLSAESLARLTVDFDRRVAAAATAELRERGH